MAPWRAQQTSSSDRQPISPASPPVRASIWVRLGWLVAAAAIALVVLLWRENSILKQSLDVIATSNEKDSRELKDLFRILAPIRSPKAQHITLVPVKTPAQPQAKVFYLRNSTSLVLIANNLVAPPPQKAYELWLIPKQGASIPAGVFKPDARGSASIVDPPLPANVEAKAFIVTIENEAGASTPTMPIMMTGTAE